MFHCDGSKWVTGAAKHENCGVKAERIVSKVTYYVKNIKLMQFASDVLCVSFGPK